MKTKIVLLSVGKIDRSITDVMDGVFYSICDLKAFILSEEPTAFDGVVDDCDVFQVYDLDDFCSGCNDQMIDLESWWLVSINLL